MNDDELLTGSGSASSPTSPASNPSLDAIVQREAKLRKQIDQLTAALRDKTAENERMKSETNLLKAGDIWRQEAAAAKVNPSAIQHALQISGWQPGDKPSAEDAKKALAELKKNAPYFFEPEPKPPESDPGIGPAGQHGLPPGYPQAAGQYLPPPQPPHSGKGRGADGVLPQTLSAADLRNPGLMGRLTPKEILAMT